MFSTPLKTTRMEERIQERVRIVRQSECASEIQGSPGLREFDKLKDALRDTGGWSDEHQRDTAGGLGREQRTDIYEQILELIERDDVLPLTKMEAEEYVASMGQLKVNCFFPPDMMIAARSIKRTLQIAGVMDSKLCIGKGLWIRPHMTLEIGEFVGFYTGWIYDEDTKMAIWDKEDRDNSYSLGILQKGGGEERQLGLVHGQDRFYAKQNRIFPLAFANEWIWSGKGRVQLDGGVGEGNALRFTHGGMVIVNKRIRSGTGGMEVTVGLGKEGVPFGGWTSYVKSLMMRLLCVIRKVWFEIQGSEWNDDEIMERTARLSRLEEEVVGLQYFLD